jgi:hypothetical protein
MILNFSRVGIGAAIPCDNGGAVPVDRDTAISVRPAAGRSSGARTGWWARTITRAVPRPSHRGVLVAVVLGGLLGGTARYALGLERAAVRRRRVPRLVSFVLGLLVGRADCRNRS